MKSWIKTLSAIAICTLISTSASAMIIFSDDFNRSNSNNVGNGWSEIEDDSNDVAIVNNVLQLRDNRFGTDAAVTRTMDTTGFSSIFIDFDWAASYNTESSDELFVGYKGIILYRKLWETDLGGSGFASETIDASAMIGDTDARLRFWTDVSGSTEAAYIDNVVVRGVRGATASLSEPGTLILMGLGLAAMGLRRKKA